MEAVKPIRKKAIKRVAAKPATVPKAVSKRKIQTVPETEKSEHEPVIEIPHATDTESDRYWEAVGRRKTAVARVRLFTKGERGVWVNTQPITEYFSYPTLQRVATEAIDTMNSGDRFRVTVKVSGGGVHAQAEAVRHGTARALVLFNPDFRKRLKRAGFLTRDSRMKERKKFGLKGARKAPQWAKR